jgi:CDP-diacylglycerol--glycerol-3-phosphate 3-phosphatidyltransferase
MPGPSDSGRIPVAHHLTGQRADTSEAGTLAEVFPLNVPNVLTLLRILAVPVLVVALLDETPNGDLLAAIVFAVASLTDAIDGYLARSRNWVTTFGKLMDPIADKLLIIGALVALVSLHRLAAWVAMVIIAREFAVTAMRMAAVSQGVVVSANVLGKLKTVTQVGMVFALILVGDGPAWVQVLVYATVAITVFSGVDYFFGIRGKLRERERARRSHRIDA